jgi:hypothetical protein
VVAVFLKGEETPTVETDIFVSGLRARDRELLERGIEKESYTEVLLPAGGFRLLNFI